MNYYDEGMAVLQEKFGNGKDNVISLATISLEQGSNGAPRPALRDVDAYYEDGVFYIVTYAQSNKMKEIHANPEVAVSVSLRRFFQ